MINKELKSELRAHRGDLYGEVKISGQVVMIKVVKNLKMVPLRLGLKRKKRKKPHKILAIHNQCAIMYT